VSAPAGVMATVAGSPTRPGASLSAIETLALRKTYPIPKPVKGVAAFGSRPLPPGLSPAPMAPRASASGDGSAPREVLALEALDLTIEQGEFFGLLGPNGAGKTTTIGVLTTRVLPTAGTARVAGFEVVRQSVAVKQRIGVVPQRPNPDMSLSVRENLVFHASYFGIPHGVAVTHAQSLLDYFGMGDKANAKVSELSGGQQQRLMIARALMHEPEVLFLDEPTVGLDPQARLALWEILRELHGQGRTIVLTTHYMEEADRLCERLGILDRGRLLALDSPADLKARAPGGTLVQLTLDGGAEPLVDTARGLPGIVRIEAREAVLMAYAERPGEVIPPLMRLAEQSGRVVNDIHLTPPSLETLFVAMTGRGLQ
jgi:ABC-2 type transport system ATP-binding protein